MQATAGEFSLSKLSNGEIDMLAVLGQIPLFQGLPEEALDEIIAQTTIFQAYSGQTIIEEGDEARELYLLLQGRVKIQVESITPYVEIGITKLGTGEVLGEMSLLGPQPRSATVVTLEKSELARIPAQPLIEIAEDNSDWGVVLMRNLAQVLSDRLRCMNRRMLNYVRARYY